MRADDFAIDIADIPEEDTEKLAYWQTRALSAQVDILDLTRRLLEADQALVKQTRIITDQANRTVKLTQELRVLTTESPWLVVVRKHLNSATPKDLDVELEALQAWYRDKKDEAELFERRIQEQAAQLSEYQNKDSTPID